VATSSSKPTGNPNWLVLSTISGLVAVGLSIWALSVEEYAKVCGHHGGPIVLIAACAALAVISIVGAWRFVGAFEGGPIVVPAVAVLILALVLMYLPGSPHGCGQ